MIWGYHYFRKHPFGSWKQFFSKLCGCQTCRLFCWNVRRHFRADGLQPTSKTSMSWRRLVPGDRVGDDLMTWQLLETFPQTLIELQPFFLLIYWSFTQIPDLILYLYALNACIYIYYICIAHLHFWIIVFSISLVISFTSSADWWVRSFSVQGFQFNASIAWQGIRHLSWSQRCESFF